MRNVRNAFLPDVLLLPKGYRCVSRNSSLNPVPNPFPNFPNRRIRILPAVFRARSSPSRPVRSTETRETKARDPSWTVAVTFPLPAPRPAWRVRGFFSNKFPSHLPRSKWARSRVRVGTVSSRFDRAAAKKNLIDPEGGYKIPQITANRETIPTLLST